MNLKEFENYLVTKEGLYPDYCKKENIQYKNCDIYSPQFNDKNIGLPLFYLYDGYHINKCNDIERYAIMNLLDEEADDV